jgi:hypothetical protein
MCDARDIVRMTSARVNEMGSVDALGKVENGGEARQLKRAWPRMSAAILPSLR